VTNQAVVNRLRDKMQRGSSYHTMARTLRGARALFCSEVTSQHRHDFLITNPGKTAKHNTLGTWAPLTQNLCM